AVAPPPSSGPPPAEPATAVPKRRVGLYAGAGAAVLVLAVGGYLALGSGSAPPPKQIDSATELQTARDALAAAEDRARREADEQARRAAEAEAQRKTQEEAAARQRAEEETRRAAAARAEQDRVASEAARQKAEQDAAARRAAEQQQAQQKAAAEAAERQRADDETRRAREALAAAEAEARQRVDAEAALRRQIEEEIRRKIEAEIAAKRQAEEEASRKAAADRATADKASVQTTAAQPKPEDDRKAAEAAEIALRLGMADRQRIQVALTSLGFDTRGADGAFGPRSRDMIAAWQKARNHPATGFLTAPQNQVLLREAAPAIARYDEQQEKAAEAKRKAEEEAKARTAVATPTPAAATPSTTRPSVASAAPSGVGGLIDGTYSGSMSIDNSNNRPAVVHLSVRMANGSGSGTVTNPLCGALPMSLKVDPSGKVTGDMKFTFLSNCGSGTSGRISGQAEGSKGIRLEMESTTTSARGRGKIRLNEAP
ncbi:MAG: peptidoglycan-binding protein, partial [Reyranella sp.]|nr:peptidoglycan-binding protein [Reyranella sp.]